MRAGATARSTQINTANVSRLAPAWVLQAGEGGNETTPLVYGGVMYLTGQLESRLGAWMRAPGSACGATRKTPPKGLGLCCGEVNRGFAAAGEPALQSEYRGHAGRARSRKRAQPIWESMIEDYKKGYSGTVAPLAVKDKVLVGTAGAEFGIRGFVDAYDAATGKRALALLYRGRQGRTRRRDLGRRFLGRAAAAPPGSPAPTIPS